MTETKTDEAAARFKPPFKGDGFAIVDSADQTFFAFRYGFLTEQEGDRRRDTIVEALNFYYASRPDGRANQRERSERKGEKE